MKIACLGTALLLLAMGLPAPVQAAPELVETCQDTVGAAVITWDCEFEDTDYSLGGMLTFTVNWTVDAGAAMYEDFTARGPGYTPKSKKDAVEGTAPTVDGFIDNGTDGSVTVSIMLVDLHRAGKSGEKANAHFSLWLRVDEDGDGVVDDEPTQFGVNLHVTDPPEEVLPEGAIRLAGDGSSVSTTTWGAVKRSYKQ